MSSHRPPPNPNANLAAALAECLSRVERPGDFFATGTFDMHPPRLAVDGVGPIALPLLPLQAEQLKAVAEQAPYGRGTETLIDTAVRNTWQIDAERVQLGGRGWDADLEDVLARVRTAFGIAGTIRAEFYKLLVYEPGSFFAPHRDTEKAPGMFATLVIVLPGDYRGGELLVRHRGREALLDLRRDEPSEAAFAAFYADCVHEVRPIHSGHRLTLIYNLIRPDSAALPEPPDYDAVERQTAELLRDWGRALGTTAALPDWPDEPDEADDADEPEPPPAAGPLKLVYPLEHAYTEAELGFDTLKGTDAAVAAVLNRAARAADCDLYLALASIEESGWAEYGGSWRDPEFEIGEVTDSCRELHDWRHPAGGRPAMDALPFDDYEVSPPGALDARDGAEPEFSEATGNEGASFERLYQRAALVLWPRAGRPAVLASGGLHFSLPFLGELVQQWETDGAADDDPRRAEARALAASIGAHWPTGDWERRRAAETGRSRDLLAALLRLGDLEGAALFLVGQSAAGAYGPADNPGLAEVLARVPTARAGSLLAAVVAGNAQRQPGACADLLARVCASPDADPGAHPDARDPWRAAALALLTALPPLPEPPPAPNAPWTATPHREPPTADLVTRTLEALGRIDPALADRALEHFIAHPAVYGMDPILLPATLALHEAADGRPPTPAVAALKTAVLAHLGARIAEPLEPPADLSRPARITCPCSYCQGLSRFLASPLERVWRLKAAEAQRKHVTVSVQRDRCDLDLTTDQSGRPYTLVCTKNQASYERRLAQRALDLKHQARLGG